MKTKLFIIWVEGLTAKTGEKVKAFTDNGVIYTTKMTEALRIIDKDIETIKAELTKRGINNPTFVPTNYAPKFRLLDISKSVESGNRLIERLSIFDESVIAAEALNKGIITREEASEIFKRTVLRDKLFKLKFGS